MMGESKRGLFFLIIEYNKCHTTNLDILIIYIRNRYAIWSSELERLQQLLSPINYELINLNHKFRTKN